MKNRFFLIFIILAFLPPIFAKQGMSTWSGPGEVSNPDYVPRIPKAQREKIEQENKEQPKIAEKKEPVTPKVEQIEPPKEEVKEEVKVEPKKTEDNEYSRSVGNLDISKDTFEADKKEIMKMISELSKIMKDRNYPSWLKYTDEETKVYWSKKSTLLKAQKRMPVKGIQLKTLEDYFKYIFVPARQQSSISEIRYESSTLVKAVEVQDDADIVYYYFKKIDGKWFIHIPQLD